MTKATATKRAVPDPRNVRRVSAQSGSGFPTYVWADLGDRNALLGRLETPDGRSIAVYLREIPEGAHTVNEIVEQGLRDVLVVVPRNVDVNGWNVAVPGMIVEWATAVEWDLVDP